MKVQQEFAKTYEEYEEIERNLIEHGFKFYDIKGRNMMYFKGKGDSLRRVAIFMSFWEV